MLLSRQLKTTDANKKCIKSSNNGYRFNKQEAIELLRDIPIGQLMNLAHINRCKRYADKYVTFVFDTNPNYTNICVTGCTFCAFHRRAGVADAYVLTPRQVALKVEYARSLGATTVLLQGGHNPNIGLKDWFLYLDEIKELCPDIHIHPFSPAEYFFMAKQEGLSVKEILNQIWDYGIRTMPGGGAEILVENVRNVIASKKATSDEWLKVCELAHKIGFKTTATMMFGHIETDEDIIDHLLKLRKLQDLTRGFVSFIPWSFKPSNSLLSKKVKVPVHPTRYIRIIATSRLVLDNFPHIQSSWFSEDVESGQLGLLAGADDFGGILVEENVHKEAGHFKSASADTVITIIKRSGYIPAQRDCNYNILKIYN